MRAASRADDGVLTDKQAFLGRTRPVRLRPSHYQPWTDEQLSLFGSGLTYREIAVRTGRSYGGVALKAYEIRHGVNRQPRKEREDVGDWWMLAACRNHPQPDIFFPDIVAHKLGRDIARIQETDETLEAKAVCAGCSVKSECLESILRYEKRADRNQRYGIWGGTTPQERLKIMRDRRAGVERLPL